jgi:hypothetical protein
MIGSNEMMAAPYSAGQNRTGLTPAVKLGPGNKEVKSSKVK